MENKPRKVYTLCFIRDQKRILLGMKKRGFGMGKWNGFGGKVLEGESIEDAAKREMLEECGIKAEALVERGINDFEFKGKPGILEVHVFEVMAYSGEPKESEEMRPEWFDLDKMPYESMWKDDPYWILLFLGNKRFRTYFLFDDKEEILDKKIEVF